MLTWSRNTPTLKEIYYCVKRIVSLVIFQTHLTPVHSYYLYTPKSLKCSLRFKISYQNTKCIFNLTVLAIQTIHLIFLNLINLSVREHRKYFNTLLQILGVFFPNALSHINSRQTEEPPLTSASVTKCQSIKNSIECYNTDAGF